MISLSTPVVDVLGSVLLRNTAAGSDTSSMERRVSRTATLDGGAVVTDGGYSAADRTLRIVATEVDEAAYAAVAYLVKNYSVLMVATRDGVFLGAPSNLSMDGGRLKLTVLVTEEL